MFDSPESVRAHFARIRVEGPVSPEIWQNITERALDTLVYDFTKGRVKSDPKSLREAYRKRVLRTIAELYPIDPGTLGVVTDMLYNYNDLSKVLKEP